MDFPKTEIALALLPVPTAFFNQAELDWEVTLTPQPLYAIIEFSDGENPFTFWDKFAWDSTADVFTTGYYRVMGQGEKPNATDAPIPVTNYSNIVSIGV